MKILYKKPDPRCKSKGKLKSLQVLAPRHAELNVVSVHATILGERHTKLISVLGNGELTGDILVDFNSHADTFNTRVVDGGLVRRLLGVDVDLGLEADIDVARGVAQVDGGVLARNVVLNRRSDVIVVDHVLQRQVHLDGSAIGAFGIAVNLGAGLRERDGDVAELVVVGGDSQRTGLARLDVVHAERDVAVLTGERRGLVHGDVVIRHVGQADHVRRVDVVGNTILGGDAACGARG